MTTHVEISVPEGVPFIDIVREFDHPVEAVFAAYVDPELVTQWLGPRGYEMEIERYDFRTGGRYRYLHRDGEHEYAFNGVFHTVRENELAIQTFEWEGMPDLVSIETIRFEALPGGRSRVVIHSTYPSVESRDGMAQSGMEKGVSEGYERLDAILDGRQR